MAKGGKYSPYYSAVHLLVDCADHFGALQFSILQRYPDLLKKRLEEATGDDFVRATSGDPSRESLLPARPDLAAADEGGTLRSGSACRLCLCAQGSRDIRRDL